MTKKVVSVHPEMPLFDAAKVIAEHNFDGVPVIDATGRLVGILTEYDLVSKGTSVHLPTLKIILENLSAFRRDRSQFEQQVKEMEERLAQCENLVVVGWKGEAIKCGCSSCRDLPALLADLRAIVNLAEGGESGTKSRGMV